MKTYEHVKSEIKHCNLHNKDSLRFKWFIFRACYLHRYLLCKVAQNVELFVQVWSSGIFERLFLDGFLILDVFYTWQLHNNKVYK